MPSKGSGNRAVHPRPAGHFGRSHPLSVVAIRHCAAHSGDGQPRVGRIACGACWEQAIRDDERVAVEEGLPRDVRVDPGFVDPIVVDRALRGARVELTVAELGAALDQLVAA